MFSATHQRSSEPVVILLAEDERLVRDFVQTALVYAGYRVLAANDGIQALELSRAFPGNIDLLLSDIRMPNMIGPELVQAIAQERPGIRVMLMTGEGSGELPEPLRLSLLRKPFLVKQLLEGIARVLAEHHDIALTPE